MLFWLNFLVGKMLKDRLEDEEDRKYILLPSIRCKKNQVEVTGLEEKNCHRPVLWYYGIYFFYKKTDNVSCLWSRSLSHNRQLDNIHRTIIHVGMVCIRFAFAYIHVFTLCVETD